MRSHDIDELYYIILYYIILYYIILYYIKHKEKAMLLECIMLQYSVTTIYGTYNKTSHEKLYFYISTFRRMRAVRNMAVPFTVMISYLPVSALLGYFLNEFEMVPIAPVATGITFVSVFHIRCISSSLYFQIFRLLLDRISVSFQSQCLLTDMFLS